WILPAVLPVPIHQRLGPRTDLSLRGEDGRAVIRYTLRRERVGRIEAAIRLQHCAPYAVVQRADVAVGIHVLKGHGMRRLLAVVTLVGAALLLLEVSPGAAKGGASPPVQAS